MKVSIIIPAYNVAPFITHTLSSLKTDDDIEHEIIVINDGSTDQTASVISEYIENSTQNIKFINQINSGVSAARNAGINAAIGEFIIFLDGDDFVENGYISELYTAAINNSCEIVTCMYNHIWENGEKVSKNFDKYMKMPNLFTWEQFLQTFLYNTTMINTGSLLFKLSIIKDNNLRFDETMTHCEDHKFFVDCFIKANKVYHIKKILYNYLQRSGSLTHNAKPIAYTDTVVFYFNLLKDTRFKQFVSEKTEQIVSIYSIPQAIEYLLRYFIITDKQDLFNQYFSEFKARKYFINRSITLKISIPFKMRLYSLYIAFFTSCYKKRIKRLFGR